MIVTLGVAAHVDCGKTTLCERLLLEAHVISRAGRVDEGSTMLDTDAQERRRGITIFSGQADLPLGEMTVTLMDTPGHRDFMAETRRAFSVMDGCLLVVSASEGMDAGSRLRLRQIREQKLPMMVFVNKCDLPGADVAGTLDALRAQDPDFVLFDPQSGEFREELASRDEQLMDIYLSGEWDEALAADVLRREFGQQRLFPVFTGSALKGEGVAAFLSALPQFFGRDSQAEAAPFRGVCYAVRRFGAERRALCRILRGTLENRQVVETAEGAQKVQGIAAVRGAVLLPMASGQTGQTVALSGVELRPGEVFGDGAHPAPAVAAAFMSVELVPENSDRHALYVALRELEQENPELEIRQEEKGICASIGGQVYREVLLEQLQSRFGLRVRALPPRVLYRETVAAPVLGIGHYEPLRHYAEVWLRLEPAPAGSGISFRADPAPNTLAVNWQRLIETHVLEKEHRGVLTGSPLADVRIVLIAGKAHLKHTEGGDFREAVYRAVRQALMQADNVLLEPHLSFEIEIPAELCGRTEAELLKMQAEIRERSLREGNAVLEGTGRAAVLWPYMEDFARITRGRGRISCAFDHYAPCLNDEEVIRETGYDPDRDMDNPSGSVFCSHGAGFVVSWKQAPELAHLREEAEKRNRDVDMVS